MASVYPSYVGARVNQIVIGTVYALIDGAIGGAAVAWLYNKLSRV